VKHYLFAGQDILVPAAPGPLPCFEGALPERIAASALGRREFDQGGEPCAALMLDESGAEAALALGLRRVALRQSLAEYDELAMKGALRGVAILRALEIARFCGACGSPLADKERGGPDECEADSGGRVCSGCGRVHFPRISPAVIVLIRKGPRALLAHNARFPKGRFGLIAGFVEAGETLEEAAAREVREEAGIEIRDLRYVKSQSWPFPDSLMVAFTAEWARGEARPDGAEIAELRWCLPSELPEIPPKGSVARSLIEAFAAGEDAAREGPAGRR
jgi:NAD+ diphosphatase